MEDKTLTFERFRPRLHRMATRLLRSAVAADEVMEEMRERWMRTSADPRGKGEAWLIFVTTQLCLGRVPRHALDVTGLLRDATTQSVASSRMHEHADDILAALLCFLEVLSPDERIAYLLHNVFQADEVEIAQMLQKSDAACRILIRSAYGRLGKHGAQTSVWPGKTASLEFALLRRFANALAEGDIKSLEATLASNAELLGTGNGKIPRFRAPVHGAKNIVYRFVADSLRYGDSIRMELIVEQTRWALLFFVDDELDSTVLPETDGVQILRLHVRRLPHGVTCR